MNSIDPLSHSAHTVWNSRAAANLAAASQEASVRLAARWLMLCTPLVFAIIAVALGKETGWDLQNYHWYNPYALLTHRLGFDIAVAHHATYYNPLIDVPFYFIARHAPAWVAGAYLGFTFGIAVTLIGALAYHAIALKDAYLRLGLAVMLAMAGAIGGGAWPAIGNTSNDVPVVIGVFAALLLVIRRCPQLQQRSFDRSFALTLALAGAGAGASAGLKLTTMVYSLGLCAAVLVCSTGWRQRGVHLLALGMGMLVGFLVCGGYWVLRLWQYGGNPVFPYFNQLFHSSLLVHDSYRDPSFQPDDWLTSWLYPFYFTANSQLVAEWSFRDAHIVAAYVLLPVTAVIMLFKPKQDTQALIAQPTAIFLFVFAAVSYVAWLSLFGVYRYLIPLEMLVPLLIAAAIAQWRLRQQTQLVVIALVLVALQVAVRIDSQREEWDKAYVSVQTPTLPDPEHSMILLSGIAPMAFTIPAFPQQIAFIRVDGWLVQKDDHASGLAREMHARIEQHRGPLYMLFSSLEQERATASAKEYELRMENESCDWVRSNIAEPLKLCRLVRNGSSDDI